MLLLNESWKSICISALMSQLHGFVNNWMTYVGEVYVLKLGLNLLARWLSPSAVNELRYRIFLNNLNTLFCMYVCLSLYDNLLTVLAYPSRGKWVTFACKLECNQTKPVSHSHRHSVWCVVPIVFKHEYIGNACAIIQGQWEAMCNKRATVHVD
jgi:hypothetical protein